MLRLLLLALAAGVAIGCAPSAAGTCRAGFADCDGDSSNGCEADLNSAAACGECGNVCGNANAGAFCDEGSCRLGCDTGYDDCDRNPANGCEADLNSRSHCGGCYNVCGGPNADGECSGWTCEVECREDWGDCNADFTDGCESELVTDQACGSCNHGCAGSCDGGRCETCDGSLQLASSSAFDAAQAIGICSEVAAARWVLPDGSALPSNSNVSLGRGLLSDFGSNMAPREGNRLLALSSGTARRPGDSGYRSPSGFNKGYGSTHPAGFPKESPACPGVTTGAPFDGIGLELELDVPEWANGLAFDFNFYTYEWPGFICSRFNDFFLAVLDPIPEGQTDGNISFDSVGNPVSVNNAFVSVCDCPGGPPCSAGGKQFDCDNGPEQLANTGFEGHAATGWLTTSAPVEPGTRITLRFAIYDSGDGSLDSTSLIDNFRWLPSPPDVVTDPIE